MENVSLKEFVELDWGFVRTVFGDWWNSHYAINWHSVLYHAALYVPAYHWWQAGRHVVEWGGR